MLVEIAVTVETVELAELVALDELEGVDVGAFVLATIVAALFALFESTWPLLATLFGLLKYTFRRAPAPQNSFLLPVHNILQLLSDTVVAELGRLVPQ